MGMARNSQDEGDAHDGILSEINITPLVDIFLVLLIIFMVTSSVMSQMGVSVKLPKSSAKLSESQPEGIIITLIPGGQVKVNQVLAKSDADLDSLIQQGFLKTKQKLVVLEGDQAALLGEAVKIMDRARKAGAESFSIATQVQ